MMPISSLPDAIVAALKSGVKLSALRIVLPVAPILTLRSGSIIVRETRSRRFLTFVAAESTWNP